MTTPTIRSLVSLAATVSLSLTLGACAHAPSPAARSEAEIVPERLANIRFDNEAQAPVYVYLVGVQREWLLGRVEAGARSTLRMPKTALSEAPGTMRLAVIAGTLPALAARDPRAVFTISQPTASIVSQRWTFAQRQMSPPEIFGARASMGQP